MLCRNVLALCPGMIASGWLVDALRLCSLGVGIVGLAWACENATLPRLNVQTLVYHAFVFFSPGIPTVENISFPLNAGVR